MTVPISRLAALAAAAVLALAGCGARGPAGPAAATRQDPNAAPADITNMVSCFRAHGMPEWPDPTYDPRDGRWHLDGPPLKAATRQACAAVMPRATLASPAPTALFNDLMQYARCMRAHGVPDWPDPTVDGAFITSLDVKADPAVQAAAQPCEKYLASSGGRLEVRPSDG